MSESKQREILQLLRDYRALARWYLGEVERVGQMEQAMNRACVRNSIEGYDGKIADEMRKIREEHLTDLLIVCGTGTRGRTAP